LFTAVVLVEPALLAIEMGALANHLAGFQAGLSSVMPRTFFTATKQ
jgi:hypothetical protein